MEVSKLLGNEGLVTAVGMEVSKLHRERELGTAFGDECHSPSGGAGGSSEGREERIMVLRRRVILVRTA